MRRVFKTRHFARWMRKSELTDAVLCSAIAEMALGLIDADLGGGVFKKRVAMPGRGKSASARTLVATNKGNRWFFVFGFEKSERANIDAKNSKPCNWSPQTSCVWAPPNSTSRSPAQR
jgi:hypothetical protein